MLHQPIGTTSTEPAVDRRQAQTPRAITVAILAMGGEGGGVLADWLVDLAEKNGYCAQTTSVPGVAQRTGATLYYVEMFPEAAARAAGKAPVLALMPTPGEVDIVIASELMEAGRAIQRGLVTPDRTTLIASTSRVYSMTEKMAITNGPVDSAALLWACKTAARVLVRGDFGRLAADNQSVISAVLFGALAGSGALPFAQDGFKDAVRAGGVGVVSSLAAFAAGVEAATIPAAAPAPALSRVRRETGPALWALGERIQADFPDEVHDVLFAGIERLADYQDVPYAAEYLHRLDPVRQVDDAQGQGRWALLREAAGHLALWMSYEDAIRVADLKTRRTRFERVRKDTSVTRQQLLQINEFLHPGIEEIADILPAAIGRWLLRTHWVKRLVQIAASSRGMLVQTTSLSGFLKLHLLANLRRWRRRSLRFQQERRRIDTWLAEVIAVAPEDYALALELAAFPCVVKGYGDTRLRGLQQFDAVMCVLPTVRRQGHGSETLRRLREAAVAEERGEVFADTIKVLR